MKTAQLIRKSQKGFTLIELLVVIGILAILLAIVLIAINPARQFALANNTKRQSDVNAILNAINQNMADNHGTLPGSLAANCPTATPCPIASTSTGGNICSALVTKYLAALPADPNKGNGAPLNCGTGGADAALYDSGYSVSVSSNDNRITVVAPNAEQGAVISVTR